MSDTMRDAFEAIFPMPQNCIRCGDGYAATDYNAWDAHSHCKRWEGFKAAQSQPAPPEITTLANRIAELIAQHGTLRAAAAVINIDVGYLSRLASGEKVRPGKKFLRRMGLRAVTTYERIK